MPSDLKKETLDERNPKIPLQRPLNETQKERLKRVISAYGQILIFGKEVYMKGRADNYLDIS